MVRKYRLKGHGGFIMREGWFTKGLAAVAECPDLFTKDKFYGADILGVGTAMGKSMRYWMTVCGLIEDKRGEGVVLTEFGQLVLENDLYFEDIFTIWNMHKNIVLNVEKATIFSLFFQEFNKGEFTKDQMMERLQESLFRYTQEDEISERSFRDDCNTLLQMYTELPEKNTDPEDKMKSVFSRLGLVRKTTYGYVKEEADIKKLPMEMVLVMLGDRLVKEGISIDELLHKENGVGKVLNLSRVSLNEALDILQGEGFIEVTRTAGLDMVYPMDKLSDSGQIIRNYYEKK